MPLFHMLNPYCCRVKYSTSVGVDPLMENPVWCRGRHVALQSVAFATTTIRARLYRGALVFFSTWILLLQKMNESNINRRLTQRLPKTTAAVSKRHTHFENCQSDQQLVDMQTTTAPRESWAAELRYLSVGWQQREQEKPTSEMRRSSTRISFLCAHKRIDPSCFRAVHKENTKLAFTFRTV